MNELLVFLQSLPEAFKTGFIYSIMVMGVYLTYKILDFPDMSVDGTFPLGGFVFAAFALSKNGFFGITSPIMGLILAVVCGMIAGYITGALHVYLKINGLLSGILVMTGLYRVLKILRFQVTLKIAVKFMLAEIYQEKMLFQAGK